MKIYIQMILLLFMVSPSYAGGGSSAGTRGGGDMQALEFSCLGRALIDDYSKFGQNLLRDPKASIKLKQAFAVFRVSSVAALPVDSTGSQKEAVTDLSQKTIQVNRSAWNNKSKKMVSKLSLVFHEYLRAAGFGDLDESYEVTGSFNKILSNKWEYSETSLVDRQYNAAARLKALIKNKILSCVAVDPKRKLNISLIVNRDEAGMHHLVIKESEQTFSEELITQFSVGENIFLTYGDDGRSFLSVPSPDNILDRQFGTYSTQATAEDVPFVTAIQCSLK